MVMIVSNIQRMSESSEVEGKGTTAAATARSTDASTEVSPIEDGREGATPENLTLGRLELALI